MDFPNDYMCVTVAVKRASETVLKHCDSDQRS